jgi:multidrug efflux pump subunit AcrA (membrane-fusion protein)
MKMGKAKIAIVASAVGLLGFGAYKGRQAYKKNNASANAPAAEKPIANVQTADAKTISDIFITPGVVRADAVVAVTTFSEGLVKSCSARLGLRVSKGQTLCLVENDNPSATYLPFQIQAPVDAVVGELHVAPGVRVNKGDKIATLLLSERAKIEIELPVSDAAHIRVGAEATWEPLNTNNATPTPIPVRVTGVSPLPDATTRTVKIELLPQKQGAGSPGALGNVSFVTNSRKSLEVPEESVVYRGTDSFLRTVENNIVKWAPVKLGRTQKGATEILEGLKSGTVFVTQSSKYLADGDEITPKQSGEKPQ